MKELPWEVCQYFFSDNCPNNVAVSRVLLIPQFLDQSEIGAIRQECESCEKRSNQRRTNLRIKRPFKVAITIPESNKSNRGTMVNVSATGALIELEDRSEIGVEEIVELHIESYVEVSGQLEETTFNQCCIVKRIENEKHRIAVIFIDRAGIKEITNF
ncbi:MAG: PilZ domain-containing protein [Deltaproteobacteria bacterium]|nr:MAG: PilZ domain-containing protein [Deltaproteobacteria bacterium]